MFVSTIMSNRQDQKLNIQQSNKTDGQILTCKSLNYTVHAMTTIRPVMDKQHSALY